MEAAWLLALIVTPLFFNIYSSRVFEPDKITLMRSLALLALAAWLVKIIREGGLRFDYLRGRLESPAAFFRVPLVVPVGALVVVYMIATVFSVAPHASLFGSYQRLQGTFTTFSYLTLFAALVANLRRRAQVDRLLTTVVICSLPAALYGIIQHYRLDPLPWGGDTTARVTANMGNAIFLAAYLIMTAPVVLGRVVTTFRSILTDDDPRYLLLNIGRAAIYIFIFAVNLVAIWFTSSRGPWLGLLAGLFFFGILLALYWRVRWLTLSAIGLGALLAVFLVALNIPNGPLETLRQTPGVGRLGRVFETEGGTGRVRVLIWSGVVELMLPHPPLEYPDGGRDMWNALRPLIGYGPEALYVAFNRFYPPALGQIEARNASPDRSHNETFDALAFTGLLGLAVYLALFVAVFYYGMKWLGLVNTPRRRNVFLGLVLGGGAVSAVAFVLWQGPEFFGVGLPFGMALGLIGFLTLYALWAMPAAHAENLSAYGKLPGVAAVNAGSSTDAWRAITLISLFSAIVAHFTEIHFGIAIVSTRTHFWLFTGLMLVVGYVFPAMPAAAAPASGETSAKTRRRSRGGGARAPASDAALRVREEWAPVLVGGVLTASVLLTLGYDFITNSTRSTQAGRLLVDSFTLLPSAPEGSRSYAILGLMLITWLAGAALGVLEEAHSARTRRWVTLSAGLGLAFLLGGLGWIVLSNHLAEIARFAPATFAELLASSDIVARTLTILYLLLLLVLLSLAGALASTWSNGAPGRAAGAPVWGAGNTSPLAIVGYVALPLLAGFVSVGWNLHVVQADIIYKTGLQFDDQGQPQAAIPLYNKALELSPGEDYYYLFLGRSFLNATNAQSDPAQRESLLAEAEAQLKAARVLNPLNTDHTANLARLNRQWSVLTTDPAVRDERMKMSDGYYAQAVRLSPQNAGLWNEWAALAFQIAGDTEQAQGHLDQSFGLDDNFDQTYQLQGDLYLARARQAVEPADQQVYFQKAIDTYLTGIEVALAHGANTVNMRLNLASIYPTVNQLPEAIEEYRRILDLNDPGVNAWQVHLTISQHYAQMGDLAQARANAELALQAAPDESTQGQVQGWLSQLP